MRIFSLPPSTIFLKQSKNRANCTREGAKLNSMSGWTQFQVGMEWLLILLLLHRSLGHQLFVTYFVPCGSNYFYNLPSNYILNRVIPPNIFLECKASSIGTWNSKKKKKNRTKQKRQGNNQFICLSKMSFHRIKVETLNQTKDWTLYNSINPSQYQLKTNS